MASVLGSATETATALLQPGARTLAHNIQHGTEQSGADLEPLPGRADAAAVRVLVQQELLPPGHGPGGEIG